MHDHVTACMLTIAGSHCFRWRNNGNEQGSKGGSVTNDKGVKYARRDIMF